MISKAEKINQARACNNYLQNMEDLMGQQLMREKLSLCLKESRRGSEHAKQTRLVPGTSPMNKSYRTESIGSKKIYQHYPSRVLSEMLAWTGSGLKISDTATIAQGYKFPIFVRYCTSPSQKVAPLAQQKFSHTLSNALHKYSINRTIQTPFVKSFQLSHRNAKPYLHNQPPSNRQYPFQANRPISTFPTLQRHPHPHPQIIHPSTVHYIAMTPHPRIHSLQTLNRKALPAAAISGSHPGNSNPKVISPTPIMQSLNQTNPPNSSDPQSSFHSAKQQSVREKKCPDQESHYKSLRTAQTAFLTQQTQMSENRGTSIQTTITPEIHLQEQINHSLEYSSDNPNILTIGSSSSAANQKIFPLEKQLPIQESKLTATKKRIHSLHQIESIPRPLTEEEEESKLRDEEKDKPIMALNEESKLKINPYCSYLELYQTLEFIYESFVQITAEITILNSQLSSVNSEKGWRELKENHQNTVMASTQLKNIIKNILASHQQSVDLFEKQIVKTLNRQIGKKKPKDEQDVQVDEWRSNSFPQETLEIDDRTPTPVQQAALMEHQRIRKKKITKLQQIVEEKEESLQGTIREDTRRQLVELEQLLWTKEQEIQQLIDLIDKKDEKIKFLVSSKLRLDSGIHHGREENLTKLREDIQQQRFLNEKLRQELSTAKCKIEASQENQNRLEKEKRQLLQKVIQLGATNYQPKEGSPKNSKSEIEGQEPPNAGTDLSLLKDGLFQQNYQLELTQAELEREKRRRMDLPLGLFLKKQKLEVLETQKLEMPNFLNFRENQPKDSEKVIEDQRWTLKKTIEVLQARILSLESEKDRALKNLTSLERAHSVERQNLLARWKVSESEIISKCKVLEQSLKNSQIEFAALKSQGESRERSLSVRFQNFTISHKQMENALLNSKKQIQILESKNQELSRELQSIKALLVGKDEATAKLEIQLLSIDLEKQHLSQVAKHKLALVDQLQKDLYSKDALIASMKGKIETHLRQVGLKQFQLGPNQAFDSYEATKIFEEKIIYFLKNENEELKAKLREQQFTRPHLLQVNDQSNQQMKSSNLGDLKEILIINPKIPGIPIEETIEPISNSQSNLLSVLQLRLKELENQLAHCQARLFAKTQLKFPNINEGSIDFFRQKNKELQSRVQSLIKLNKDLQTKLGKALILSTPAATIPNIPIQKSVPSDNICDNQNARLELPFLIGKMHRLIQENDRQRGQLFILNEDKRHLQNQVCRLQAEIGQVKGDFQECLRAQKKRVRFAQSRMAEVSRCLQEERRLRYRRERMKISCYSQPKENENIEEQVELERSIKALKSQLGLSQQRQLVISYRMESLKQENSSLVNQVMKLCEIVNKVQENHTQRPERRHSKSVRTNENRQNFKISFDQFSEIKRCLSEISQLVDTIKEEEIRQTLSTRANQAMIFWQELELNS